MACEFEKLSLYVYMHCPEGTDEFLTRKSIPIYYCPFCGRKLRNDISEEKIQNIVRGAPMIKELGGELK